MNKVRLYSLHGGYIDIHDMSIFSDTHFYPPQSRRLANPCFLIQHPQGWLLWDFGLGDQYLNHPFENIQGGFTFIVPISLASQLKQLSLTPNDITFIALSHNHIDHTGNLNLFSKATLLMQQTEYQQIEQKPNNIKKILFSGNYDVFGDGTIEILSMPGHTPGHASLKVNLANEGTLILSGDLYHTRQAYLHRLVPTFNTDRQQTLTSMDYMEKILEQCNGKLIIQHDLDDFESLPKLPQYWD
ncbi:MAG: N-acyl homoserine lactonase family protein [Proteobacteria bacterium]|nr:N-acyl homoserine lactonase family protein [Pseudomonadota bacterium]